MRASVMLPCEAIDAGHHQNVALRRKSSTVLSSSRPAVVVPLRSARIAAAVESVRDAIDARA
jgi:hypothetical protein